MEPMTLNAAIALASSLAEKTGYSWIVYKREQHFYVGRKAVLRSVIEGRNAGAKWIATFSVSD